MEIFSFGLGVESAETSPGVLGGKGAGLVWMDKQGINVPPGFIIPTSVCLDYLKAPKTTMTAVAKAIKPWVKRLEAKFGYMPLVSVRSGARASMPGMMDTILNVGLDESSAEAWVARLGAECVADSRRRLVEMYGAVVKGINRDLFEGLSPADAVTMYVGHTGEAFPDAQGQLMGAIEAVFKSWNNERAKVYRAQNNIPENWGTAVTVQAMVFGNLNDKSCTGVLFTRNCNTGENVLVGEWLENAQGEDVVAGIRTPKNITGMKGWNAEVAEELYTVAATLETAKNDVQDVEFTVQDGKLFVLQTRNAKRTSLAAIRIAMGFLSEGKISTAEVFKRVSFKDFMRAQGVVLDPTFKKKPAWKGTEACSGIVTGKIVLSAEEAVEQSKKGPVVLVSKETTPDDIAGMAAAVGVVTMTGGNTSHAAVVARGMNRCCVVGVGADLTEFVAGKVISVDGSTGRIWKGEVPTVSGKDEPALVALQKLMAEFLGASLIDEKDADALDLTGLLGNPALAAGVVKAALKTREKVIVDVLSPRTEAQLAYEDMFGAEAASGEAETIAAILKAVGPARVKFLTSLSRETVGVAVGNFCNPQAVQLITGVTTAEGLVEATTEYILETQTPAMLKIAGWKKQIEGVGALLLGQAVKGGYASRTQMAAALLS